ncbi:glycosyltransferase [Methanohalophilus profundi]|uniref:glycosyltransferase n=1 Tax=Methanohalophilus profundi TaxID=2138083 RepID=UPI00101D4C12|nr:glycosyltransferase [Methanohalophilus profundi]
MNNFIMVTPAKNEEQFLPKVIDSIASSSLIPDIWIIVDDNSSDNTPKILNEYKNKCPYIEIFTLNEAHPRDLSVHYSYVCNKGFDRAIQLSKEKNVSWDYIVLLDADTIVSSDYFDGIFEEMNRNERLGISSGNVHLLKDGKIDYAKIVQDIPSGTARVWRRKCFEETGGYMITHAPDSVSRIKAKLKGWDTFRFDKYEAYQLRETASASGLWNGYIVTGKSAYYLQKNPILVFLNSISHALKKPHYTMLPFLYGYTISILKRDSQIDDDEIRHYFKYTRLFELASKYIKNILR